MTRGIKSAPVRLAPGSRLDFVRIIRCVRWRTATGKRRQSSKVFGVRVSAHWRTVDGDRLPIDEIKREAGKVADCWLETAKALLADWQATGTLGERTSKDLHAAVRALLGPQYWRLKLPKLLPRQSLLVGTSATTRTRLRIVQSRAAGITKIKLDHPSIKGSRKAR